MSVLPELTVIVIDPHELLVAGQLLYWRTLFTVPCVTHFDAEIELSEPIVSMSSLSFETQVLARPLLFTFERSSFINSQALKIDENRDKMSKIRATFTENSCFLIR